MAGSTLTLAPDGLRGRQLGKYEVICRLSTGGMAEILLASQRGLAGFHKPVVLKKILPDIQGQEEFVRMFLDEAKVTAAFNHPHIAQVYDLDVDQGELFLAMEFVPGATLVEVARATRAANEPMPIGLSLAAVRDTALALHYAHTFTDPLGNSSPVIHRDVAEKNIMVTYEGVTKLLDFGIAKNLMAASRTQVGMVKGTSGYMSPEQILGELLDARSDLFSLGVVLHECLTGMRLFHGKSPQAVMHAVLRSEIPLPSRLNKAVPPELDAIVLRALARRRDERHASTLEFARELERTVGGHIWLPEQSGALMKRLFSERREETRQLLASGKPSVDATGQLRLSKLFSEGAVPTPTPSPTHSPTPPPAAFASESSNPSLEAPRTPLLGQPPAPTTPGRPLPRLTAPSFEPPPLPPEDTTDIVLTPPSPPPPPARPRPPAPREETLVEQRPRSSSRVDMRAIPEPYQPEMPTAPSRPPLSRTNMRAIPEPQPEEEIEETTVILPPRGSRPELKAMPEPELPESELKTVIRPPRGSRVGLKAIPEPQGYSPADSMFPGFDQPASDTVPRYDLPHESDEVSHEPATQPTSAVGGAQPAPFLPDASDLVSEETQVATRPTSPVRVASPKRSWGKVTSLVLLLAVCAVAAVALLELDGGRLEALLSSASRSLSPKKESSPPPSQPGPEASDKAAGRAGESTGAPTPTGGTPASATGSPGSQGGGAAPSEQDGLVAALVAPKQGGNGAGTATAVAASSAEADRAWAAIERARSGGSSEQTGTLKLVTQPQAKVYLGTHFLGETPLSNAVFPPGKYTLRLLGSSGKWLRLPVEIKAGKATNIRKPLAQLSSERAAPLNGSTARLKEQPAKVQEDSE